MSEPRFCFIEIINNDIRLAVIIIRHRLIRIHFNIKKKIKIARMRQFVFRVKLCNIRKPYLCKKITSSENDSSHFAGITGAPKNLLALRSCFPSAFLIFIPIAFIAV